MNAVVGLAILAAAIVFYAVVNSIEIAVVAVNRIRVHHLADAGSKGAQALRRLHQEPERFFAAIVLLQNVAVVLAASMGSLVAVDVAGAWGVAAATLLVAVATALFGELTPKVLAAHASERFAVSVAMPAEGLTVVLAPLVALLGYLPRLLARGLFGVRLAAGPAVSEAELRMLIGLSAETGSVEEEEAQLLDRVFHFGDRRVHEVMVPRTEVVWLQTGSSVREFYNVFAASLHSRFPVIDGSPDTVVGIVGIKDVLLALSRGEVDETSSLAQAMRPAYFVPEMKLVRDLFREMQAGRVQMAIAVDEYGGTAGIVTLEQLLEEMVGAVRDEIGPAEEEIRPLQEGMVNVDGGLSVAEAREELGLEIPEGPYDTIAGFVLSVLGHIPQEGEWVLARGLRLTVVEMKGPKIEVLRVTNA